MNEVIERGPDQEQKEPRPIEKILVEHLGEAPEWAKLSTGKFYNPVKHDAEIDGSKLLIFHARDDESVRWNEVAKFARATGATLKLSARGGHLSSTRVVTKHWKQIAKFLKRS